MVYVTRGLVETLLRLARDADPEPLSTPVSVTEAGEIPDANLPPEVPVFTHFYLPDTARSVNFVFGVDLGTPVGQTQGRFVSHPVGELEVTKSDDLHEVIFVAVPPWDEASFAAFDRRGNRRDLTIVDATPPEEHL